MQEVQANQEQIIQLQGELADVRKELEDLEDDVDASHRQTNALLALYSLQQHYSNQDYDACRADIAAFEEKDYEEDLPEHSDHQLTPPVERYHQLKSAVESLEATD